MMQPPSTTLYLHQKSTKYKGQYSREAKLQFCHQLKPIKATLLKWFTILNIINVRWILLNKLVIIILKLTYTLTYSKLSRNQCVSHCINFLNYIHNVMSQNKSNSKYLKLESPAKSPRYQYGLAQTLTDRHAETKQTQKVTKLKDALKQAQHHNQQLHTKVKHYKKLHKQQILAHQQQKATLQRELEQIKATHSVQIQQIKSKMQQQVRSLSVGKITNDTRVKQLEIQCKSKDMKITQLQGKIKDLNSNIQNKNQQIKQLQLLLQKIKIDKSEEQNRRASKTQDQLQAKAIQSQQYYRQNLHLKQSLRDSLKKVEKANSQNFQQIQKNKALQQELKQSRKLVGTLQKESAALRQSSDKIKTQTLERMDLIRKLQKSMIQGEYKFKRQQQLHANLNSEYQKKQTQFRALLTQYQNISNKYQQLISTHYELQRDFQRELHTIVKELTRRHLVSKSIIGSMGSSSRFFASTQRDQDTHTHELP